MGGQPSLAVCTLRPGTRAPVLSMIRPRIWLPGASLAGSWIWRLSATVSSKAGVGVGVGVGVAVSGVVGVGLGGRPGG